MKAKVAYACATITAKSISYELQKLTRKVGCTSKQLAAIRLLRHDFEDQLYKILDPDFKRYER